MLCGGSLAIKLRLVGPRIRRGQSTGGIDRRSPTSRSLSMLRYALIFLVIALLASAFGMFGLSGVAMEAARILFFVFLVMLIISVISGRRGI
jgi:uncharacterized membrane protein YtjA (UPF0391 family)